jgi:hypothetical protein
MGCGWGRRRTAAQPRTGAGCLGEPVRARQMGAASRKSSCCERCWPSTARWRRGGRRMTTIVAAAGAQFGHHPEEAACKRQHHFEKKHHRPPSAHHAFPIPHWMAGFAGLLPAYSYAGRWPGVHRKNRKTCRWRKEVVCFGKLEGPSHALPFLRWVLECPFRKRSGMWNYQA